MCFFLKNRNRVLTRTMILNAMWDDNGSFVDDNTLSVYIRRLREKIEDDPSNPRYLKTVRGFGYQWKAEEITMYKKRTTIKNKTGLHARPASEFIAMASKFSSRITIKKLSEDEDANAKSIVMLLALGLAMGEEVEIVAKGDDEVEAVDSLIALIDSKFGED